MNTTLKQGRLLFVNIPIRTPHITTVTNDREQTNSTMDTQLFMCRSKILVPQVRTIITAKKLGNKELHQGQIPVQTEIKSKRPKRLKSFKKSRSLKKSPLRISPVLDPPLLPSLFLFLFPHNLQFSPLYLSLPPVRWPMPHQ
jgi:hypothetical protein